VPGAHGLGFNHSWLLPRQGVDLRREVRNGFVPASRREVFEKLRPLVIPNCPFVNLPETHKGAVGRRFDCRGYEELYLAAQVEFLEWTESDDLRHSKFVRLREDKDPGSVG
jgi:ATP-dependent DNA ligase